MFTARHKAGSSRGKKKKKNRIFSRALRGTST